MTPAQLDNTFYRVSVKAIILDSNQRLLVFKDKAGDWEVPGGGWEHGETLQGCLIRELQEEVQAKLSEIGQVSFVYAGRHENGHFKLCLGTHCFSDRKIIAERSGDYRLCRPNLAAR